MFIHWAPSEVAHVWILFTQTLHGRMVESVEGEPLRFGFRDSEGCQYQFQVGSVQTKAQWLSDLSSILSSQQRMRKG